MPVGFLENLDTFRAYADCSFRLDMVEDWRTCLENELEAANDQIEFFSRVEGMDKTKFHNNIEGNIRYYKPSFGWDLRNRGAHLGNLHKFRKLHPVFRKTVLEGWLQDLQYAIKVNYCDLTKDYLRTELKNNNTKSS
jgi:hypothetical protein